jgi:hypothetical protein
MDRQEMIIIAVVIPIIIGYLLVNIVLHKKSTLITLAEKIALGYLLGTSLLTAQMFVYSLFGLKFNPFQIALPWVLLLPAFMIGSQHVKFDLKNLKPFDWLLSGLIAAKVIYVFFEALIKPVVAWDAIMNWSLRAKIFFFEKTVPLAKDSPFFMGLGMKQYPLQIPLLETWTFLVMGGWDDVRMKLLFPLYFCALLIIFYASVRNYKSRTQSLFFTFLLSSLPLLTYHATVSYADFVVGAYFLAAVAYLYRYFQEKENRFLVLSSLLICAAGWVKDEGVVFYFICLFLVVLYEKLKGWKKILVYSVPLILFAAPWLTFKRMLGLELGNVTRFAFEKALASFFHPNVLAKIAYKTFLTDNWHLLPLAFIIILIFYWREILFTNKKYILIAFGAAWGFFMFLYIFTTNWSMVITDIILSRNYLTYLPLAMLLMALTFDFKLRPTAALKPEAVPNIVRSKKKKSGKR